MIDLLLKLLGVDHARLPQGGATEFVWTHAPNSWGVFVLLAVVVAVVWGVMWLYRGEINTCPLPVRIFLGVIRVLVLLALAVVFLGPAIATHQKRVREPYLVVLVDESLSMNIKDQYVDEQALARVAAATGDSPQAVRARPPSRAQLVNQLLSRHDHQLLRELQERGTVQVMAFSNKAPRLLVTLGQRGDAGQAAASQPAPAPAPGAATAGSGDAAVDLPALVPTGQSTNLAKAVREALRSLQDHPGAGVVLITDGQSTEGDDPLSAADAAAAQGVPLFTVGIGDPTKPRNIRVSDAWARDSVWREDPFQIEAAIRAEGFGDIAVPVELVERSAGGDDAATQPAPGGTGAAAEAVVARKTVTLSAGKPQEIVSFEHIPRQSGKFFYLVRVEPQPFETVPEDNVSNPVPVTVLSEQARVLLVAGAPSWEYQLLRDLLMRDKSMNLSCWLQSMDLDMRQEGRSVIDKLPDKLEDLVKYDAVLMLDPNPVSPSNPLELNEQWVEMLKRYLEQAGGFLYMAGPRYSGRFLTLSQTAGFRDVLPVTFGEMEMLEVESMAAAYTRPWPLALTAEGREHPVLRFDVDPAANRTKWDAMPGVFWSFPARGAKPASKVLIEHSDPSLRTRDGARPLVAAGQYGAGRTAYLGFDGTWRWRAVGKDSEYFDKFWVQTVRYLVEGRRLGGRRGLITTKDEVYHLGDTVSITARLFDVSMQPLVRESVAMTLRVGRGGATDVPLRPIEGRPGYYEASVVAAQLGLNELTVTLPAERGTSAELVKGQFTVKVPDVEFRNVPLAKGTLVDMAQRGGGAYLDIDELHRLPLAVPDRRETIVIPGKPVELWDGAYHVRVPRPCWRGWHLPPFKWVTLHLSPVLLLLVILLTVEWAVRKAYKLL